MSWEEFMDRSPLAVQRWKALYEIERREKEAQGSGAPGTGMKKGRS